MSDLINEPDASRLIFGLRDTGYNFRTAAADIIDNSIAANADKVQVRVDITNEGKKYVYFGDDGDGMNDAELHAAMRYGAAVRENLASLGKFGLGLKTASSSVCRHFAVISRKHSEANLNKLAWDLDHVEDTGRWAMRRDPVEQREQQAFEELCGVKGTLVVWSKCDRVLSKDYDNPGGAKEQAAIKRIRTGLIEHLALIYHRFLDAEDKRERHVTMSVNDESVEAWNPFYPEKSDQVLSETQQSLKMESADRGDIGAAHVKAWILPHSNDLTSDEKAKAKLSNSKQGFYIYREGRLINHGGWLGLFTQEPHYSMLRVEFDFDHRQDEAFDVDVKKSTIRFDPEIENHLTKLLSNSRRDANARSRRKQTAAAISAKINHASSNISISSTPTAKKPKVESVDADTQTAVVTNSHGAGIKIRQPVQNNVDPDKIHVHAVKTITSGDLWVPVLRSENTSGHVPGVELNKHHDFYQKIYQTAGTNGYSVQGMDLLLWAFAVSEMDNSNEELAPIFEDIRNVVSSNLKKLLRDVPLPDSTDLSEGGDG